jgi:tetratricopeptide (TPR) repeat protein
VTADTDARRGALRAQVATLRLALRRDAPATDRLPVLADMVNALIELCRCWPEEAADFRGALDDMYAHAKEMVAEPPDTTGDHVLALCLLADVCMLRGGARDLDEAIEAMRAVRTVLPDNDPGQTEVELELGAALCLRAAGSRWGLADVTDAIDAFTAVQRRLPSDDTRRQEVAPRLAILWALRFGGHAGAPADRDAAIAQANQYLAWLDAEEGGTAACRLAIAWMALCRQFTTAQRSASLLVPGSGSPLEAGPELSARLARLGEAEISVADAESAIAQLREISDPALLDDELPGTVAVMWGLAILVLLRAGRDAPDVDRVAAELDRVARLIPEDAPGHCEMLAFRAGLFAARAATPDASVETPAATEAVLRAATSLPPEHPLRSPLLGQLGTTLRRQMTEGTSSDDVPAELERVLQTLERLPEDTPGLEQTLTLLSTHLLQATFSHRSAVPLDRVIALLEKTIERLAPGDTVRILAEGLCASAIGLRGSIEHRPEALDEAEERLRRSAALIPVGHVARPLGLMGAATVLAERYIMSGELRHLKSAEEYIEEFLRAVLAEDAAPWAVAARGAGYHIRGTLRIARYQHDRDPGLLYDAVSDLELAAGTMSADDPLHARVTAALGAARALSGIDIASQGTGAAPPSLSAAMRDGLGQALVAAGNIGPEHVDFPALTAQAATGLVLEALANRDMGRLDEALSVLTSAYSVSALTVRERSRLLHLHGSMLLLRYQTARDARDLSNAIDRLEEARRAVEQEDGSPYASAVLETLAAAYRARGDAGRGDVDRAVTIGLAALRENAGDVLLQSSDEDALGAGRAGTVDGITMARWFLDHGRPGPAVSAIELGRGMVLYAATAGSGLTDVLRQAGHVALADEWARERSALVQAGSEPAGDLRYRIMLAIEGSEAEARLLAAPSVADIRGALASGAADALIYLLPRDEDGPGTAVTIDTAGTVTSVPLPSLRSAPGSPIRACEQARKAADQIGERSPGYGAARQRWRDALGELCDWAWQAIGPLLGTLQAASGRLHRVVLVPVGELGLVPWHAARRRAAGGYRYACEDAVFCYAASARQFIDAARLRPRPWADGAVLISDSEPSLYATTAGVEYIRARYYPAGAVFGDAYTRLASPGVPGSAAATPADVLGALPGAASGGASMLHFGCHGQAKVPVLTSRLDLGAGGALAVRDILRQAREGSQAEPGGLVVLASCLSDVTEADYDEALTLATAFLSAGAAGVVGARWSVEEAHAALFMVSFHRQLNLGPADPAQALRSAYLWMLDPGRASPDGLPTVLRDEASQPGLAHPAAWAAFAYRGR